MKRKTIIVICVIAAVAVVAVFVLHKRVSEERAAGAGGASSQSPPQQAGEGEARERIRAAADSRPDDVSAEVISASEEAVAEDKSRPPAERSEVPLPTGTDWSAEAIREVSQQHLEAAIALPSYHHIADDLKKDLEIKYGRVTPERVPELVETAVALEEAFWEQGDLFNLSSFDALHEARALLEMCLEVSPNDEKALREMCEVLQAGWPVNSFSSSDIKVPEGADEQYAHWLGMDRLRFELYVPMRRLWTQHIRNKADPDFEDILVAWDLAGFTNAPNAQRTFARPIREYNPNPDPGLARLFERGIPKRERIEVLDWAIEVCKRKGESWAFYRKQFEKCRDYHQGRTPFPGTGSGFFMDDFTKYDSSDPLRNVRYYWGRGKSFVGPEWRREMIIPRHVAEEAAMESSH